jgi:hypothetical protein
MTTPHTPFPAWTSTLPVPDNDSLDCAFGCHDLPPKFRVAAVAGGFTDPVCRLCRGGMSDLDKVAENVAAFAACSHVFHKTCLFEAREHKRLALATRLNGGLASLLGDSVDPDMDSFDPCSV